MLTPDELARAGEQVAAAYRQVEDLMLDALVGLLIEGEVASQRYQTAMQLLSQSAAPRVRGILESHRAAIDATVRSEVESWLELSDARDLAAIKRSLGVELPGIASREAASVVQGVAGILARDNLAMEQGAAQAFLEQSTWAIAQVSSGAMTAHRATREAAVRLAGQGIPIVTYRDTGTGRVTVANQADVAVRRHVRTQLSQATMSRTLQVCRDAGVDFVEVSSHSGARITHAEWHGRVYSLDGDKTVDGVRYRDFWTGTGYQGRRGPYTALGDQLGGVNCRHTFGPWLPGTPRAYSPDPEHPSGLSNDEVYELTQKQRAQERAIRKTKRELMAAREAAEPGNLADTAEVVRLQDKLKSQQAGMRKLIDEANANGRVLTRSYPSESVAGFRAGGAGGMSRALTSWSLPPVTWSNAEVSALETAGDVADFLRRKHGIFAEESFTALPLDIQRGVAAGIDRVATEYGKSKAVRVAAASKRSNYAGRYTRETGTIAINPKAADPYITALHEGIHAADVEKSLGYAEFATADERLAYNLHSAKVLADARKSLKMTHPKSRAYVKAVMELADNDVDLYHKIVKEPREIVAYAIDHEEAGRGNELSAAIAERFKRNV